MYSTPDPSTLSPDEARAILAGAAPVEEVPWTPELALQIAGVDPAASRGAQEEALRAAVLDIPPLALEALLANGWENIVPDNARPALVAFMRDAFDTDQLDHEDYLRLVKFFPELKTGG
jgi:hypothetical protein